MQMRFRSGDETTYVERRNELSAQFAEWLSVGHHSGDSSDAELMVEWKWGYGDGALDRWTVGEIEEFLFDWRPRVLPADCVEICHSVAAFMDFMEQSGLLTGGDTAALVRAFCESNSDRFVEAMGDPSRFGMAKTLFDVIDDLELDTDLSPEGVAAVLAKLGSLTLAEAYDVLAGVIDSPDRPQIGPVRISSEQQSHFGRQGSSSAHDS